MKSGNQKQQIKKIPKWLFWTPRILTILFMLFLALFSLDIFDSCNSILSCLLGLFMHNLPVLIILVLFIIAWKHELVGAITFFVAGLLYIVSLFLTREFHLFMIAWMFQIALPAFVVAYLYYLNWKRKNELNQRNSKK